MTESRLSDWLRSVWWTFFKKVFREGRCGKAVLRPPCWLGVPPFQTLPLKEGEMLDQWVRRCSRAIERPYESQRTCYPRYNPISVIDACEAKGSLTRRARRNAARRPTVSDMPSVPMAFRKTAAGMRIQNAVNVSSRIAGKLISVCAITDLPLADKLRCHQVVCEFARKWCVCDLSTHRAQGSYRNALSAIRKWLLARSSSVTRKALRADRVRKLGIYAPPAMASSPIGGGVPTFGARS